jgi:predicted Na+-dependent transporter
VKFILKYKRSLLGLIVGAAVGYAWYAFIGCKTGTCAITSSPVNSTLYFAGLGALMANTFNMDKKDSKTQTQVEKSDT